MLFMHPAAYPEHGQPPPADVVADMMRFNGELAQAGVLLALDGLTHPEDGACVPDTGAKGISARICSRGEPPVPVRLF